MQLVRNGKMFRNACYHKIYWSIQITRLCGKFIIRLNGTQLWTYLLPLVIFPNIFSESYILLSNTWNDITCCTKSKCSLNPLEIFSVSAFYRMISFTSLLSYYLLSTFLPKNDIRYVRETIRKELIISAQSFMSSSIKN